MTSKNVLKLKQKILEELGLQVDENSFRRTRAGRWLKSSGSWIWTINAISESGNITEIGSTQTLSECIKKKYCLEIDDNCEVYAENKVEG